LNGSDLTVLAYCDRDHRNETGDTIEKKSDAEVRYHFKIGARNDLMAGAGYRLTAASVTDILRGYFQPDHRDDSLFSVFVQDEIELARSLTLTFGSKLEHNPFTGFEYEPSAQLVWTPRDRQSVWLSAARAIRQPSLEDSDLHVDASIVPLPNGNFGVVEVAGNPALKAERMLDYELGYRNQVSRRMHLDASTFFSDYRNLRTSEPGVPYFTLDQGPPHEVIPIMWGNLAHALDYGVELSGTWDVTSRWRLSPGFGLLHMDVTPDASSGDTTIAATGGSSPKHQAKLRSSVRLSRRLEWDTSAYFVGMLSNGPVPAYTRLDTHLGWTVGDSVYFSVSGQNLLSPRHFEFLNGSQVLPTEVERSVVGKITWRF
jgi:iron complex outermembrane receptor protein